MTKNIKSINIAKFYNTRWHAEGYFRAGKPRTFRDRISDKQYDIVMSYLDNIELQSNKLNVLDIGCSSGRITKGLKNKGNEVIGVDTAIIPLKYASERIDAIFIQASATNLIFKKESFDLVVCIELLHHFTNDLLEKVLMEISEVIKPGGFLIFDLKNKINPLILYTYKKEDCVEFTLKARTIREMSKLVEKNGFEKLKEKGILFPIALFAPYVVILARKKDNV